MIFINWPHEQQKVAAFLTALGIKFLRVPPVASQELVQNLLTKWNDPTDDHEVFLLSSKTAALGLNLHKACHRLVVYSIPENINTLIQIIGRVHRIGQLREQYIWLLTQDTSYDQILRAKAIGKFLLQVLGDSDIKDFSSDEVRRTVLASEYKAAAGKQERGRPDRATVEEHYLNWQVLKVICNMLGFRSPPHGWDNYDLTFKNTLAAHKNNPYRVRATMPHEVALAEKEDQDAQKGTTVCSRFSKGVIVIGKSGAGRFFPAGSLGKFLSWKNTARRLPLAGRAMLTMDRLESPLAG